MAALAADPTGAHLGLTLPAGRVVEDDEGRPILWISDDEPPDGDDIDALRDAFARTGLWPLILEALNEAEEPRPWLSGEIGQGWASDPDRFDADEVLARWWAESVEVGPEADDEERRAALAVSAPYHGWPGRAVAVRRSSGHEGPAPDDTASEMTSILLDSDQIHAPRLGLIACARSSDVPAAIGWMGPANFEEDVATHCSVLRTWEDRFGTRLIGLGFDIMRLSVANPPTTYEHAIQIAAEHFAFCPDNIDQGAGTLENYARTLVDCPAWVFWWD